MKFDQAKNFVVPWGDYKGKKIDDIAGSDKGLKDLDKMLEWMESKGYTKPFRKAVEVYLSDPVIKRDLENLD